jgi:hypothetical protein
MVMIMSIDHQYRVNRRQRLAQRLLWTNGRKRELINAEQWIAAAATADTVAQ